MSPERHPVRPRRRLVWRVYLYMLLMLVLISVAAATVFHLSGDQPPIHRAPARLAAVLAGRFGAEPAPGLALDEVLDLIHQVSGADMGLYRRDGTRIAAAGSAPEPLAPERARALRHLERRHDLRQMSLAVPLRPGSAEGAYFVFRWAAFGGPWRGTLVLAAVLLVLGLVSIPLARSIARPLEQLTRAARRIAGGELAIRTGIQRRDELGVLARSMEEMAARLDQRIRSEKELLANVSHELRTPLARIRVALELCAEDDAGMDQVRSQLAGIEGDLAELERLVDDVLQTSRLDMAASETGGMRMEWHLVEPAAVAEDAATRFASAHPEQTFSRRIDADLPVVRADPVLLRRVLDNLLGNAASHAGATAPVDLVVEATGGGVCLEVYDRGPGVAEDDLPSLFEPFFRTDRSRAAATGGSGLGLALCKRIVEAHGGRITARNREEGGLVVQVTLPGVKEEAR